MERTFVGAGLFAGLIAGIITFIYARIFIEPLTATAIDYEEYRAHAEARMAEAVDHVHGHGPEHELFSRVVQENVGAAVGTIVFAIAIGAFFAVAFTVVWAYVGRRRPSIDPRGVAAALGVIGFIAVIGIPFVVYPPNPPAVGESATIGERSGSFLTITIASILLMSLAVTLTCHLWDRIGGLVSGIVSSLAYLFAIVVVTLFLPGAEETPGPVEHDGVIYGAGFPAQVLGDFRVYAIVNQVILWTVLVTVFCLLYGVIARRRLPQEARAKVAA
ncbi:MAG: CbtA family protein [Gordonia sp. (in: high G+C Gram-positive bacteria)]